jgi:hypothetical protein
MRRFLAIHVTWICGCFLQAARFALRLLIDPQNALLTRTDKAILSPKILVVLRRVLGAVLQTCQQLL